MSRSTNPPDGTAFEKVDEQLQELREIEEDLRRVAESDTPYAEDCRRLLDALEEASHD